MRIVSLLPSTTEILFAIGAGDEVVGVTFECDFPPEARSRPVVSLSGLPAGLSPADIDAAVRARVAAGDALYRLDHGALRDLGPDLVVTQDLCAVCAVDVATVDAAMSHLGCDGAVLTIDPLRLDDVLASIGVIGAATGHEEAAAELVLGLRDRLSRVAATAAGLPRPRVAVLEWTDPPFSAGHWVPDLVVAAGGTCVLGEPGGRSVPVAWPELAVCRPELVVVAPCGFGLEEAHGLAAELVAGQLVGEARLPAGVPVWAVDADAAFVRPGPRLVDGVEALAAVCHPGAFPPRPDVARYVGSTSATTNPSRSVVSPTLTSTG